MLPPEGICCSTAAEFDIPIADISHDLCNIAAFLHQLIGSLPLVFYHDWWQHDGLHFERFRDNIHKLFAMVGTPRDLCQSVPHDEYVFVGVAPLDDQWYLRFRVGWNELGEVLVGEWSLTFPAAIAKDFADTMEPKLRATVVTEDAVAYFKDRIL